MRNEERAMETCEVRTSKATYYAQMKIIKKKNEDEKKK